MKYPDTKKIDLVELIHGVEVEDPHRWLEDVESEEVKKWAEAQNELSEQHIKERGQFGKIFSDLKKIWNYPKKGAPINKGGKYFFLAEDGIQNHAVFYFQKTLDSPPEVLLNPNKWSEDGSSSLNYKYISNEGKYVAYGRSESGSDRQEIKIFDVEKREDLPETLKWCRFTVVSWKKDSSGFFYNRFPEDGSVPPEDMTNYSKIYFHGLKNPQEKDELIYEDKENKKWTFHTEISLDGEFLMVFISSDKEYKNKILIRKIDGNEPFTYLIDEFEAEYKYVFNEGDNFYLWTNMDTPLGRIISLDLKDLSKEKRREVIPETKDKLENAKVVGGKFVLEYLHDARTELKIFSIEGEFIKEIPLPDIGTIYGINGEPEQDEAFFKYFSFTCPGTVYKYDFVKDELIKLSEDGLSVDSSKFVVERLLSVSKDGTKVPFFAVRRKDLTLNSANPTILYGYGGFNIPETPVFSVPMYYWIEKGGVYVLANLRGGGEFGEEWHKGGMLENKQNVFDDFISVAEFLIENKYTKREKLAIRGGSNGGLLTGACMVQRPDLFGAVVCEVGVLDMLRYHRWTVGRYWIPEYGDPEKEEDFKFLFAYSPLHNVKEGVNYPPILIITADTDDRVFPAHSFKFAAALQDKSSGKNPVLLSIEKKAGHGHGKPVSQLIEKSADIFTFLFKTLGVEI